MKSDSPIQNKIKVAAILVTRHRTEWLIRSLKRLRTAQFTAQHFKESNAESSVFPLIEVDLFIGINGADHRTQIALQKYQSENTQIHYRVFDETMTPAAIRNHLARQSREQAKPHWLYFIDDDAFVPADFFLRFVSILKLQPKAFVLGGPNLTPPDSPPFSRATGVALSSRFGSFLSRARYLPTGGIRMSHENELILCNLFVRAMDAPQRIFPENFHCGEENLFLFDMQNISKELVYDPDLFVWHERRDSVIKLFSQVYAYGKSRNRNFRYAYRMGHPAHFIPSLTVLFTGFAGITWIITGAWPSLWIFLALIYLATGFVCAFSGLLRENENLRLIPAVILSFITIHLGYGIGFMAGAIESFKSHTLRVLQDE